MVDNTKPEIVERCCSKCGEMKNPDRIVRNRNICKDCCNAKRKDNAKNKVIDVSAQKVCVGCKIVKNATLFIRQDWSLCRDCNNLRRRKEYQEKEEVRKDKIKQATNYKRKKKTVRDEIKQSDLKKLEEVKAKTRFRNNRLKCKDCEREDPFEKFKRYARTRIYNCLKRNKNKHAHEYLGCKPAEYLDWILYNTSDFTLENYGQVWHIDHIIPLCSATTIEELIPLCKYTNLQPLKAIDNLKKGGRLFKIK